MRIKFRLLLVTMLISVLAFSCSQDNQITTVSYKAIGAFTAERLHYSSLGMQLR
ncbi:hypothetical protein [Emticicia soli]